MNGLFRHVLVGGLIALFAISNLAIVAEAQSQGKPQSQRLPLIRDAEIEGLLRLYARPIFKVAGLNPSAVRVYVIANPKINAFVSGGQRMFIHTGLLTKAKTPNQVIGVLAHETGHIAGGHLVRMTDELKRANIESIIGMLAGAAAVVGGAASGSSEAAQAGQGIMLGSQSIAQRRFLTYQRSMEASADEAALKYLSATGQSAKGMLDIFDGLARDSLASTQNADPYLFSHPMPLDRIRTLEKRAKAQPNFNKEDEPALQLRHDLVKAKLAGFMESPQNVFQRYPKSDVSLPARYARSIALFRRGDLKNSLPIIDSLIADLPQSPYFWELKGQALLEAGKPAEALGPLQKARKLLPNNGLLQILEARARIESGSKSGASEAISLLRLARKTEPDTPELFKLTAQAYALNKDIPRAELATAEFALLVGDRELAIDKATFAQGQFKQGTPEWIKAGDILAAANSKKRR